MIAQSLKSAARNAALIAGCSLALSATFSTSAWSAVIGYVSSTQNYTSWSNAVTGLGATVDADINFNLVPTGLLTGGFYAPSEGVSMSQSGGIQVAGSMLSDGFGTPHSDGDGAWASSRLLLASSAALSSTPAQSVTFTFNSAVLGAGIFLVDYFGSTAWTITARDINNAVLGSYTALTGTRFQQAGSGGIAYKYFMGIESTLGDIASVTFSRPGTGIGSGGDNVGLDDFRFATLAATSGVPEPGSLALLGLGLVGLGAARRRKAR